MIKKLINILKSIWKGFTGFFPWYINLYRGRKWYTKTALGLMSFVVFLFLYLGMVDINFLWLFGKSPGFYEIIVPPKNAGSEVYSADSVLLGRYLKENRIPVRFNEISPSFWNALIDTEDERFYSHHGIDFEGIGGAMKDAVTHNGARGASTITQQLAKNLFKVRKGNSQGLFGHVPGVKIIVDKSKEWIIAIKLELIYSKDAILTMYANTVDFGNNSFGIKTAAKTYFNTTPDKLTPEQSALLVGMLKATSYYNPISRPQNAIKRRNQVLLNMKEHGHLSAAECDLLLKKPLELNVQQQQEDFGQAKYFREAVAKFLKQQPELDGYDLYSSGLRIYTTIDTRLQKYAEQAVTKQMRTVQRVFESNWGKEDPWRDEKGQIIPNFIEGIAQRLPIYKSLQAKFPNNPDSVNYYMNKKHEVRLFDYEHGHITKEMSSMDSIRYMVRFMHSAFVAIEPQTGAVKAWVGDIDYDTWNYDKVTAERQPGSTFKLFVYTEAIAQGLVPCDKRQDKYFSMQVMDDKTHEMQTWAPTNANGYFTGDSIPLRSAFARSINSIAAKLGQEVGISNVIKMAQKMGIKSPLKDKPSLALGSSDVNLLEMVGAYTTIANEGEHHEPVLVTKVVDDEGNVLYEDPDEENRAINENEAFLMQEMLKAGLVEPGGTSQPLNSYTTRDTDWGGKTGTSNNHSDAWFIGVSPNLVCGAWVGGEYRCIHFRYGKMGQGSRSALPIVGNFIKAVWNDPRFNKYHAKWPENDDVDKTLYQCQSYWAKPQRKVDTVYVNQNDEPISSEEAAEIENNDGEATNGESSDNGNGTTEKVEPKNISEPGQTSSRHNRQESKAVNGREGSRQHHQTKQEKQE